MFARSPYELDANHDLPVALQRAIGPPSHGRARASVGETGSVIGMSFWTDAAILGNAGVPSVLYGPTGAGLHSIEEWVDVRSMLTCRDTLVELTRDWCR